jgi:hypothetical protein
LSRCVVDHILQEFNTLFLTRFITYKIATPPQTKTPVKTTFRDWCLYSSFVHGQAHLTDCITKDCGAIGLTTGCSGRKEGVTPGRLSPPPPVFGPAAFSQLCRKEYLTFQPARPHGLAELISWNRFLASLNVYKFGLMSNFLARVTKICTLKK